MLGENRQIFSCHVGGDGGIGKVFSLPFHSHRQLPDKIQDFLWLHCVHVFMKSCFGKARLRGLYVSEGGNLSYFVMEQGAHFIILSFRFHEGWLENVDGGDFWLPKHSSDGH